MAATDYERTQLKKSLREMGLPQKISYFFSYYTIHFILAVLAVVIITASLVRILTRKEVLLYFALTNTAIGSELESELTDAFLSASGFDSRKNEIELYKELYISNDPAQENHEYAYASSLKVMAAINAEKMDLVLMNKESYDVFSGSGYLQDLTALLKDSALLDTLEPYLVQNEVTLADNSLDVALGEAAETKVVTETVTNAVNVSDLPAFRKAGFPADIYIGVIANSPREGAIIRYLAYLTS